MEEVGRIVDAGFGPENPFFAASPLPFQAPAFDRIKDEDYLPAIEAGMEAQRREIRAISESPDAPTFENTAVAMERSGRLFARVMSVFGAVAGANTNDLIQAVQQEIAPKLAAHGDAIYLDATLFARVDAVFAQREGLGLDAESLRLLEVTHEDFVHAGAKLTDEQKARITKLNEEESTLQNAFATKLLAANKEGAFCTTDREALAGLSEAQITRAAEVAKERGVEGYVLVLHNTTQQPILADLTNRETRRAVFEQAWNRTEQGGETDTRAIVTRLAALRAEKAEVLGKSSYAEWKLENQMAKAPGAAGNFLDGLVSEATVKARTEAAEIQALIDAEGGGFALEPWDWEFYADQVRKARFDLDEAEVKPYFEVYRVLEDGVFFAASGLYGLRFEERKDLPVYHPDMRVFEVFDDAGKTLALFYVDFFKRDNKRGGAWMSEFVGQSKLLGTIPVVYNVCNFAKPAPGEPGLISFDDVITMFHEFGHGLHGILSDVTYPSLAGTSVPRDFVEFPSQFNEHWALYPEVFAKYARHYKTGAAMPGEMARKLREAEAFNKGYRQTEVLAAAQLDMQWHTLAPGVGVEDPDEFERKALEKKRLALKEVPPRYRSSYFAHIWGGGYAAGYYAYLWSESLEVNAFQWFEENGGLTRENGQRLREMVLSRGNSEDLEGMYRRWIGRDVVMGAALDGQDLGRAQE